MQYLGQTLKFVEKTGSPQQFYYTYLVYSWQRN